jgi:recombination protein RecA
MDDLKFIQDITESVEGASLGKEEQVNGYIDSGSYALNYVITGDMFKGYPKGRVVELFGDPSTGKSLCIYTAIAEFQRQGGVVILDDTEYAFSEPFGKLLGVDCSSLIVLHSETVEEHFEKIFLEYFEEGLKKEDDGEEEPSKKEDKKKNKKRKAPIVDRLLERFGNGKIMVCLDSVAQLSTRHELDVKFEKSDMTKAKKIRTGIRLIVKKLSSNDITYLISNHTIANIGNMYDDKTTPGGKAIPFQCAVRLELNVGKKIFDSDDQPIGVLSRVYCKKNKVSIPFRTCGIQVEFDKGLNRLFGWLDLLVNLGIVAQGGAWYTWGDKKFQSKNFAEICPEIIASLQIKT